MPGRKMPGHFGDENVTVKNVEIVEVQADEGLILVKGPVPGARNGLVKMHEARVIEMAKVGCPRLEKEKDR
jgi:ribosomal protein L3